MSMPANLKNTLLRSLLFPIYYLLPAILLFLLFPTLAQASDWLEDYAYRKQVPITGTSGAGIDYQVPITVYSGSDTDTDGVVYFNEHNLNWPNDIRFTDNDGTTLLDHWRETTGTGWARFWIEVKDNLDANRVIYIYYGKSGAESASDGPATFDFFEHWDTDTDTANFLTNYPDWEFDVGSPVPGVSNSILTMDSDAVAHESIAAKTFNITNYRFRARMVTAAIDDWTYFGMVEPDIATSNGGDNGFYLVRADAYSVKEQKQVDTVLTSWNYTYPDAPWTLEMTQHGGTGKMYFDGTEKISTALNAVPVKPFINSFSAGEIYVDWIAIGKYVEVEPQVGTTGEEESFDLTPPTISSSPANGEVITTLTPEIVVTYSDPDSGVDLATLQILLDNVDKTSLFTITETQASYQVTEPLSEGNHTTNVSLMDNAGNLGVYEATFMVASAAGPIPPEGGTVAVTDPASPIFGASIEIPDGAITEPTTITIHIPDPALLPPLPDGVIAAGPAVDFGPAGTVFTQPVTITMPYWSDVLFSNGQVETALRLFKFDYATNEWVIVPIVSIDTDNNLIIAETTSLSPYQAGTLEPTQFIKVSGDNQVGLINTTLTDTFVTRVLGEIDGVPYPIEGQEVTYTVTQGTGLFVDPPLDLGDWGGDGESGSSGEPQWNPPEPPELETNGYYLPFKATGTEFILEDNPCFPNLVITSTQEVHLVLEAITNTVSFHIEPISTTTQTETTITISGLEPFWQGQPEPIPLYRHQEGYLQEEFTVDSEGKYTYVQDISKRHHVYILTFSSTIYITEDTVLTTTVYEPIVIDADNITLDGQNNLISGTGSGYGIYLFERTGVTIKNCTVQNFEYGIYLDSSSNNNLMDNTANSNKWNGIDLRYASNNNTLTSNTAISNRYHGINIYYCSTTILTGNTMSNNLYNFSIILGDVGGPYEANTHTIDTTNTVDGKSIYYLKNKTDEVYDTFTVPPIGAIYCIECDNITVKDLILTRNGQAIYFWKTHNSTAQNVDLSKNTFGIYFKNSSNNNLINSNVSSNRNGMYLIHSSNNIVDNNIFNSNPSRGILFSHSTNNNFTNNTVSLTRTTGNGIGLTNWSDNNTFVSNIINSNLIGINIYNCRWLSFTNNILNSNSLVGCLVGDSYNNNFINNTVSSSERGIWLTHYSSNNIFTNNTISSNDYGFRLEPPGPYGAVENNRIFHNSFINNTIQVQDESERENFWDNGYPSGGNYWSDYTGSDPDGDMIGNTPYYFEGGQDNYPFMVQDGWLLKSTFTMTTNENGYVTAWPFLLGSVGEVNFITATVSGTDLSVVFEATSTEGIIPVPELDPECPIVVSSHNPVLSGTVSSDYAGYEVSVYLNGELVITTTVNSNGTWSIILPWLEDGTYTFDIQLSDTGEYSDFYTVEITIETIAPEITVQQPAEGITITAAADLIFEISYSDASSGVDIETLDIYLNNSPITQAFTINSNYAFYYPDLDTPEGKEQFNFVQQYLLDGSNELKVGISDFAGNHTEPIMSFNVTLDTIPPQPLIEIALRVSEDYQDGLEQEGLVGRCVEIPLVVQAYNALNPEELLEGIPLSFVITQGGGIFVAEEGYSTVTDSNGEAGLHYHYATTPGMNKVEVGVLGDPLITPVLFSLEGYLPEIEIVEPLNPLYIPQDEQGRYVLFMGYQNSGSYTFGDVIKVKVTDPRNNDAPIENVTIRTESLDAFLGGEPQAGDGKFLPETQLTDANGETLFGFYRPHVSGWEYEGTIKMSLPEFINPDTDEPLYDEIKFIIQNHGEEEMWITGGQAQIGIADHQLSQSLTVVVWWLEENPLWTEPYPDNVGVRARFKVIRGDGYFEGDPTKKEIEKWTRYLPDQNRNVSVTYTCGPTTEHQIIEVTHPIKPGKFYFLVGLPEVRFVKEQTYAPVSVIIPGDFHTGEFDVYNPPVESRYLVQLKIPGGLATTISDQTGRTFEGVYSTISSKDICGAPILHEFFNPRVEIVDDPYSRTHVYTLEKVELPDNVPPYERTSALERQSNDPNSPLYNIFRSSIPIVSTLYGLPSETTIENYPGITYISTNFGGTQEIQTDFAVHASPDTSPLTLNGPNRLVRRYESTQTVQDQIQIQPAPNVTINSVASSNPAVLTATLSPDKNRITIEGKAQGVAKVQVTYTLKDVQKPMDTYTVYVFMPVIDQVKDILQNPTQAQKDHLIKKVIPATSKGTVAKEWNKFLNLANRNTSLTKNLPPWKTVGCITEAEARICILDAIQIAHDREFDPQANRYHIKRHPRLDETNLLRPFLQWQAWRETIFGPLKLGENPKEHDTGFGLMQITDATLDTVNGIPGYNMDDLLGRKTIHKLIWHGFRDAGNITAIRQVLTNISNDPRSTSLTSLITTVHIHERNNNGALLAATIDNDDIILPIRLDDLRKIKQTVFPQVAINSLNRAVHPNIDPPTGGHTNLSIARQMLGAAFNGGPGALRLGIIDHPERFDIERVPPKAPPPSTEEANPNEGAEKYARWAGALKR